MLPSTNLAAPEGDRPPLPAARVIPVALHHLDPATGRLTSPPFLATAFTFHPVCEYPIVCTRNRQHGHRPWPPLLQLATYQSLRPELHRRRTVGHFTLPVQFLAGTVFGCYDGDADFCLVQFQRFRYVDWQPEDDELGRGGSDGAHHLLAEILINGVPHYWAIATEPVAEVEQQFARLEDEDAEEPATI